MLPRSISKQFGELGDDPGYFAVLVPSSEGCAITLSGSPGPLGVRMHILRNITVDVVETWTRHLRMAFETDRYASEYPPPSDSAVKNSSLLARADRKGRVTNQANVSFTVLEDIWKQLVKPILMWLGLEVCHVPFL